VTDAEAVLLRRLLVGLLLFGLLGALAELILLRHYESPAMLAPFATIAAAGIAAVARLLRPSPRTVWWLRLAMMPLLAASVAGAYLHYRGGVAFQADMDPTLPPWRMFWKVLHMQAPPTLAPGVLAQLGLLGLASTYRDPLMMPADLSAARRAR
jgi:hypothetical protein